MAESFKVTSIQGTDDDATVTIEQVAVHVEGKPAVDKHPVGRTGVTMSDFNYQGATEAINNFDLLRSTPRQIAKEAVAAFLTDNELYAPCPECEGSGRENSEIGICMTCIGRGFDRAGSSDE